jgi:transcriptional regulator with XRE-family HTH domain
LAARAGTTQSDIARLETGRRLPTLERVRALVRACGFELTLGLRAQDDDWAAVSRNRALSIEDRWDKTVAAARFVRAARSALPTASDDQLRSH